MTKFAVLPALGSEVVLGGRTDTLPTSEYMEGIRPEVQPFYPWYRLCPRLHDIITVDSRPGKQFFVERATSAGTRDRWVCEVSEIVAIDNGVLTLGPYFQWTITLPGAEPGEVDECLIAEVEIIGQAKSVFKIVAPLTA